jgi:hypothetical protein
MTNIVLPFAKYFVASRIAKPAEYDEDLGFWRVAPKGIFDLLLPADEAT